MAESQLARTSEGDPRRGEMYLRLAIAQEDAGDNEGAIRTYARLVQEAPDFGRMDEVLYRLGRALGALRQHDRARQVYHRLIRGYPESRFLPFAWLSFADYYYEEGDPSAARQFYTKILELPPERNAAYGWALYRSAWCMVQLEDFRGALSQFVRVVELDESHHTLPLMSELVDRALSDSVRAYAHVGRGAQALAFYRRYAPEEAEAIVRLVADELRRVRSADEAAAAMASLVESAPDRCADVRLWRALRACEH